jgi:hypothetical protein
MGLAVEDLSGGRLTALMTSLMVNGENVRSEKSRPHVTEHRRWSNADAQSHLFNIRTEELLE